MVTISNVNLSSVPVPHSAGLQQVLAATTEAPAKAVSGVRTEPRASHTLGKRAPEPYSGPWLRLCLLSFFSKEGLD